MIDWLLAEKIGTFVAGVGEARVPNVDLAALAAESESRVVAYTGLEPAAPLPPPEGISRKEWVKTNVATMQTLLDPVLDHATKGLGPLKPAMKLAVGVVLTTEVGVVIGYLGQRVLGQYELVMLEQPESARPPRLLFVMPNLGAAVKAFGADEQEFMTWVALHEVTHAVQFGGVPWLQGHMAGLIHALLDSAEVRMDRRRRLRLPSRDEIRRVTSALRRGDFVSLFASQAERDTLDRVQAVMAVIEGHAEHVMDAVAPDLLPSLPRLRGAIDQRRKNQSLLSRIIAKLLGLEMKMRQYERGKYFCDEVVHHGGVEALRHVFSSPEALPTLAEIDDPTAWLARQGLAVAPAGA
ncbi:MAG: zinc-dependent metalloprotease [Solirubrobacteraceae bacterium]